MIRPKIAILIMTIAIAVASCAHDADRSLSTDSKQEGAAQQATRAQDTSKVPVTSVKVRIATVPLLITAFGSVTGGPNSQASLAFPEAGRIARIFVAVGDRVNSGQLLAWLDTGPFSADTAQAQARLQATRTQLAVAERQLMRQQRLLSLGIASRADVDNAQTTTAAARADIQQAQAALVSAEQKLAYATLIAPFDGIVIGRLHNKGETVDQTMTVIEIANVQKIVFTAQFVPEDARRIQVGEGATVRAQGSSATARGRVIAINPSQSNDTRSVAALIRLDTGTSALGPGAFGTASIQVGTRRGLVVPATAIVQDPTTGAAEVLRRDGGHYTPVPVNVTVETAQVALVEAAGLRAGDIIAATGAFELLVPAAQPNPD